MIPFKENLIAEDEPFPVDIFIQDNLKRPVTVQPHWHDCYEILYMLEGSADQSFNDKHLKVYKNDIILLNAGDIHSTYCASGEDVRILVVKFLPRVIDNSYSRVFEAKYVHAFMNNRNGQVFHLSGSDKSAAAIHRLMLGLYEEYLNKEPGYEIYIKGYLYQLIAGLVRSGIIQVYRSFSNAKDLEKIDRILKYIENSYSENIDLKKAADLLNLSYSYFSRYFKKVTGRTFKEYVDFVRICEAEKLILSSSLNISQAAYEAGFCNVSSFNRVFKRVRGYPPGEIKRTKTAKK